MALVLLLMFESEQADSHWAPFLAMIPLSFDTPLFWDDAQLGKIQGTPLHSETVGLKRILLAAHEREVLALKPMFPVLQGVDFSLDKFLWAVSTVWNRAYWLDDEDTLPGIVPMADMMNHSASRGLAQKSYGLADYHFDSASQCFKVTSCYVYVPGDEVFTSYGHKDNDSLLADYGFLLENLSGSSDRFTLLLLDTPAPTAPLDRIRQICIWLKLNGLNFDDPSLSKLKVCPSNPIQLLAYVRLLQLPSGLLDSFTEENSADLLAEPPIQDTDTELRLLQDCIRICLHQPLKSAIHETPTESLDRRSQLASNYMQWYRKSLDMCLQKLLSWRDMIEIST